MRLATVLTNPVFSILLFWVIINPYNMPLPGNNRGVHKIFFFIFILTFLASVNAFSQSAELHVLFEDVKAKLQSEVTHQADTVKTHFNDRETKQRIAFLNRQFSTTTFSKNSSVAYWYCNAYDNDNKRLHFEIVSMVFKTNKERDAALAQINKKGREIFKLKVLTRFKVKTSQNELLIAYTETQNKRLAPFWEKL
jgi:hypothetical protein